MKLIVAGRSRMKGSPRLRPPWPPRPVLPAGLVVLGFVLIGGVTGLALPWHRPAPTARHLTVTARQYAYNPSRIHVNSGDTLHIRLASLDVVHGFFVEGHDIDAEIHPQQKTFRVRHPSNGDGWREVEELTFVAGRPGKYRYRCSHTCGTMHPFMLGEMVVDPNLPFHAGVGSLAGLFLGMVIASFVGTGPPRAEEAGTSGEENET